METLKEMFLYLIYFGYICLAVLAVQRRKTAGGQCAAALCLCGGAWLMWRLLPAFGMVVAVMLPIGALAGLVLLALTGKNRTEEKL